MPRVTEKREHVVTCPKCGNQQKTKAVTGFKCRDCGHFFALRGTQKKMRPPFDHFITVPLAGYCSDCGLMRMENEKKCARCGGTGITNVAPPDSKLRICVGDELQRFQRSYQG